MQQTAQTASAVGLAPPRWAVEPTVVPVPEPQRDATVARWLRITVIALGVTAAALAVSWTLGGVFGG